MSHSSITDAERAIIALAVQFGCSISADMERRIRADERARVVESLLRLDIFAISSRTGPRGR